LELRIITMNQKKRKIGFDNRIELGKYYNIIFQGTNIPLEYYTIDVKQKQTKRQKKIERTYIGMELRKRKDQGIGKTMFLHIYNL
jgi:hypothetical protein